METQQAVLVSLKQASSAVGYKKKGLDQRLNTATGVIDFGDGRTLQTFKIGGRRLVHRAVLQKFLDDLARAAPTTATPATPACRRGRPRKSAALGLEGGAK